MLRLFALAAVLVLASGGTPAQADEGMWPFESFPADRVEQRYGFKVDQAWLDRVRMASLRIPGRCSASFVSPHGLVQTNHHCLGSCLADVAPAVPDIVASGFHAPAREDERACPGFMLDQLLAMTDVTEHFTAAIAGKQGQAADAARVLTRQTLINDCTRSDNNARCEVTALHGGAMLMLYKYRRYTDVRLVFVPEATMAEFGGESDNFEFPRTSFDVVFLRVYVDDKPLDTSETRFRYATTDAQPGDLVFAAGSPGFTFRARTVAQLKYARDVENPVEAEHRAAWRDALIAFSTRGDAHAQAAKIPLEKVEAPSKTNGGRAAALVGSPGTELEFAL